jgi:hypothetical protein
MRYHSDPSHSFRIACLGLLGIVAAAGCGGSDTPSGTPDAKPKDTNSVSDVPATEASPPSPILALSTSALAFGDVDVGQASTPKVVTVTNSGGLVSLNPTVTPGAGFAVSTTTCATPSASCTISVTFTPTVVGAASGTLTVAAGLSVTLSGNGRTPGSFTATSVGLPATVAVNLAVPIAVTITSTGALTGLTCLASGADLAADPTVANTTCTGALAAGATCQYGFIFKAATAGVKTESVVCSAGSTSRTVALSTNVPTPASISITPPSAPFSAALGASSLAITFNVGNSGGTASGTLTTTLAETGTKEFTIVDNKCAVPLAPLATCAIQVVFTPTDSATKTATLTVADSTPGSVLATATLTGVPSVGGATITGPASLGSVIVGKSSAATTYTVTNSGNAATGTLTMATNDPAFVISNDLCTSQSLAAGKSCTLSLTFSPTVVGVKSILLTASAGGNVLGSLQIGGTGATPAVLSMTPTGLDFGTIGVGTTSTPQTFTVTNTGGIATGPLTVTNAGVGGASQFSSTTTCQAALAASGTCEIVVTFKPTAAGAASANFSVSDGTITSPVRTAVGTALERPGITIGCVPSTFADTVVGQTSAAVVCTVTNDSTSKQATGALTTTMAGDFAVTTNNCGASLEPGTSCTMSIVFKPIAAGARTGSVTVAGASGGTGNHNLSGTGLGTIEIQEFTAPGTGTVPVVVTAGNYDFGSVSSGATSDTILTLAVYIRSAMGNISLANVLGTPAEFTTVAGAVSATWPGTTTVTSVSACPAATTTAPTPSATIPYCTIKVQFSPLSKGAKTGSVTATAADGVTKGTATFKGTAAGPLSANPSTVTFAAVAPGTAGNPTTIAVCNNATTQATAGQYTITGTNAADFTVTKDELSNVTIPGKTCVDLVVNVQVPAGETATSLTATLTVSAVIAGVTESDTVALAGSTAGGPALEGTVGTFADTPITAVSAPVTVTVKNSGGLSSGALAFSIPTGSEFTMTQPNEDRGTCATTCTSGLACTAAALQAGGSCTIRLWFSPTHNLGVGGRSDTLRISGASGGLVVVPLSANASSQFTVTVDTLDLGAASSGGVGAATKSVTVKNVGGADADMTISFKDFGTQTGNGVVAGGVFAFDPTPPCQGATLAQGATCIIGVQMVHSEQIHGSFATTLLATNSTNGQSASVVVRGTAGEARLRFTPATDLDRNFGTIRRNGSSGAITYTVINEGDVASGAISFGLYQNPAATQEHTGDFTVATGTGTCDDGNTTLAAGASCNITLTFNPVSSTDDTLDETLIVRASPGTTDDGLRRVVKAATTTNATVAYMGTNTTAAAGVYDFGTTAQTVTFAVYNAGTTVFTLPTAAATFPDRQLAGSVAPGTGEFSIATGGTCGGFGGGSVATLAAGTPADPTSCTFRVKFAPNTTVGTRGVTLTAGTLTMPLYGRVGGAVLVASPSSLSFGNVTINNNVVVTHTVTFRNIGDVATGTIGTTRSSTPTGDLEALSGCTGVSLAANGGLCALAIRVQPSAVGVGTGTATVQFPPPTAPAQQSFPIAIDWVGVDTIPATISFSPTGQVNFGSIAVLASSSPTTVTLRNPAKSLPTGALSFEVDNPDFTVDTGTGASACGGLDHADGLVPTSSAEDTCTVTVTFTPRTLGTGTASTKNGTLTVRAPFATTVTKGLTGLAVPALSVSGDRTAYTSEDPLVSGGCTFTDATATESALCAFGSRPVTTPTTSSFRSETITFVNAAGSPTTGTLVADIGQADAGQYKIVNDECTGTTLAGSATCRVTVRFVPTSSGLKNTASLVLSGNPGDSVTVRLTGSGSATAH